MKGRVLLFPALALAHLAVLLMLLQPSPLPSTPVAVAVLTVIAVPEPQITVEAVPPPAGTDIVAAAEAPDFTIDADVPSAPAEPCALDADIQTALATSPAMPGAVDQIPVTARSVSNALLLWDGGWASAGNVGGAAALEPIRTVVRARIRAASTACQQEVITGPRLMLVPHAAGTVVLAFGSGVWRWAQLL